MSPASRIGACVRLVCAISLGACTAQFSASEPRWEPIVVHEGDAPFERVRAGDADPASPGLELVGVDQGGSVVIVRFDGERAVQASAAAGAAGLFLIGAAITLFTGRHAAWSGLRQLLIGLAAAGITWGAGRLFGVALGG